MLINWRRDPDVAKQIEQLKIETKRLKRDNALLDWMHSELGLIEADLPSSSTLPPTIGANSSDC